MDEPWTIGELAERTAAVLAADPLDQASGRVRDVPNERLIRWYTTIGLVDPPLSRRGRTAWYGRRHLLQLVAVKRRQAEGHALADIQAELTGATDATLEAVARLTVSRSGSLGSRLDRAHAPSGPPVPAGGGDRGRFWAQRPASRAAGADGVATALPQPPQPDAPEGDLPSSVRGPEPAPAECLLAKPAPAEPVPVHGIRLAPGVMLLLETAAQMPAGDDLAAIADAAAPLLDLLARRSLVPATASESSSHPSGPHSPSPEGSRT